MLWVDPFPFIELRTPLAVNDCHNPIWQEELSSPAAVNRDDEVCDDDPKKNVEHRHSAYLVASMPPEQGPACSSVQPNRAIAGWFTNAATGLEGVGCPTVGRNQLVLDRIT